MVIHNPCKIIGLDGIGIKNLSAQIKAKVGAEHLLKGKVFNKSGKKWFFVGKFFLHSPNDFLRKIYND